MGEGLPTVRELRRRWRPTKEARSQSVSEDPLCIRMHRAFSWMARAEECSSSDPDYALVSLWIAFNALYGRWDEGRCEPLPDRQCWQKFLLRILQLDSDKTIARLLETQRPLVMSMLDDEYLSSFFWEEPSPIRASKSRKAKFDARTWYVEGKWGMVLERVLERIYLMRCQLVHGAATHGGKLNRTSLIRCVELLHHLLASLILVVIDHGADEDWGAMCYPPLGDGRDGGTR